MVNGMVDRQPVQKYQYWIVRFSVSIKNRTILNYELCSEESSQCVLPSTLSDGEETTSGRTAAVVNSTSSLSVHPAVLHADTLKLYAVNTYVYTHGSPH